jgi:NitT/TauT family transport system substrate-binding protein
MKKTILIVLIVILLLSFAGCKSNNAKEQSKAVATNEPAAKETVAPVKEVEPIKIATLAGPTGMGLIGLINDETGRYEVEVLTQPDQISPKIINKEVDIATVPSNLAAVLFNKMGGGISVVAVNTTGVLYLLSNDDSVSSLEDIANRTVIATGQGASPEYIFNKILSENNLDVKVEYLSAHADLSNAMAAGDISVGLLPEPFVSITLAQNQDLSVKVDLNDEWQKIFGENASIPMGVTIVSNDFIKANPEGLENFISDYKLSVDYVNFDTEAASKDIEAAGILPKAAIAKLAIPRCGISFFMGETSQSMLEEFLEVLYESNPKSVGGALPGEEFYYKQ